MKDLALDDLKRLTTLIQRKYNYDFSDYAFSSFKRRVLRVFDIHKVDSIDKLIEKLDDIDFSKSILSELTVNVTEMFRDPQMWIALRDQILPVLFQQKGTIKIWHAGCSSGEEVVSLSILLRLIGANNHVEVIASDIDPLILKRAKKSFYTSKSMELNRSNFNEVYPEEYFNQFFEKTEEYYVTREDLLENIEFIEHDLCKKDILSQFDLILCRNVLIYFNQKLQNEVLKVFDKSMSKGGCLVVGAKESLLWCKNIYRFTELDQDEKVYQKNRA